ncbi:MAG: AAA family ATPase [Bacteroidetes bacterium]|nr:AAA family ATPase [Bacteroidota bacterium]
MTDKESFEKLMLKNFVHEPTIGQSKLIKQLTAFAFSEKENCVFLLKGYAGTGKTSIVGALVKTLPTYKINYLLLAPTGRAAKVLSNYSRKPAFTIHKKIYTPKADKDTGGPKFVLQANKYENTIFIIDEASMIGDGSSAQDAPIAGSRNLLDDLMQFSMQGKNCKLLFIGDTAQLPPVGLDQSPALSLDYLKTTFPLTIHSLELTEVMRQAEESGILSNATALRYAIKMQREEIPKFSLEGFSDIHLVHGNDLMEALGDSFRKYGEEGTMVICRSNKRANAYNQQIRNQILWRETELAEGDLLMVVKNNYYWLPEESKADFIANGDILELKKIKRFTDKHGFRFADVTVKMLDYTDDEEFDCKLILNTISSESPALTFTENNKLYQSVAAEYMNEPHKGKRFLKTKNDPFFNALQVKFAYAVTCHKAQGGQWPSVFVEQGYLTEEMVNTEFLRWLYTAITRASSNLYLLNFNAEFIKES